MDVQHTPQTPPRPLTTEEKLDRIVAYLDHLDKRDKFRTWSGFARGFITVIPTILLLLSVWYAYANADALFKALVSETAKQAANYTQYDFTKQFQQYFKK